MAKRTKTRKQLAQEVADLLGVQLGEKVYSEQEAAAWAISPELRIAINKETPSKPWAVLETGPLDRPLFLRFFGWFKGLGLLNTDFGGNPIVM